MDIDNESNTDYLKSANELSNREYATPKPTHSSDSEIVSLCEGYDITNRLLDTLFIRSHPTWSEDIARLQDDILAAVEAVQCRDFADVAVKIDLWRRDNSDVESPSATRGERFALQALADLQRLNSRQQKAV